MPPAPSALAMMPLSVGKGHPHYRDGTPAAKAADHPRRYPTGIPPRDLGTADHPKMHYAGNIAERNYHLEKYDRYTVSLRDSLRRLT